MIPILLGAFIFIILVFWVDPRATDRTLFYILPLTLIVILGVYANNFSRNKWMFGAATIGLFCVVAGFLFLTLYLANTSVVRFFIRQFSMFTIPFLILLGVAAVYPILQTWVSHQSGHVQGIMEMLLFLPCVVRDIFDYFVHEFQISTSTTRIILLVQLGIFLLYFGGPFFYDKIIRGRDNSYLYKETFLFGKTYPNQISIRDNSYFQKHPFTNYSVSFWVFQNGVRLENDFHSVINYGERPHVRVRYDQLQITNRETDVPHIVHIPLQKWVHVVCSYEKNKCKIYVDGDFHSTVDLQPNPFVFSTVTLGDKKLRGNGGIRYIKVKSFPMTHYQIRMEYLF